MAVFILGLINLVLREGDNEFHLLPLSIATTVLKNTTNAQQISSHVYMQVMPNKHGMNQSLA